MNLEKMAEHDAKIWLQLNNKVNGQIKFTPEYGDMVNQAIHSISVPGPIVRPRSVVKPVLVGIAIGVYLTRRQHENKIRKALNDFTRGLREVAEEKAKQNEATE